MDNDEILVKLKFMWSIIDFLRKKHILNYRCINLLLDNFGVTQVYHLYKLMRKKKLSKFIHTSS